MIRRGMRMARMLTILSCIVSVVTIFMGFDLVSAIALIVITLISFASMAITDTIWEFFRRKKRANGIKQSEINREDIPEQPESQDVF